MRPKDSGLCRNIGPSATEVRAQFGVKDRAGSGVTLGTQPGVNVKGPSVFRFWGQGQG